ncbi:MAG: hypothetical protein OXS28_13925 [Gammaproteobacteria bacterium]|nr:hypothetical protein [Gammaproteobacteria bacterium]MDE0283453.1 hypothetical protein [Gammaproteobacteria bacterium]
MSIKRYLVILLIIMPLLAAQTAAQQYGSTDFHTSGDPEAHALFIRGLVMLHNFEYEDARAVFRQARTLDPDFVMAYWGEALTHEHPLWNQQNLPAARAVLEQLAPSAEGRVERAQTEREKAYIRSVNILFGEGDARERDYAYSAALGTISETWPEDVDAGALYALSVLTTSHGGRDFYKFMQAGAITEELMDRAPRHPGVLHYNIHSYDDPVHAPLGLRAADVYSEVAPAAVHALHMPSHIYFALGDYERAGHLNARSFEAALDRIEEKNLPYNGQAYHSLSWLIYSRLQEGRFDEARRLVGYAEQELLRANTPVNRTGFITCRSNYIIDTQNWDDPLLDLEVNYDRVWPSAVAMDQYVMGMRALRRGDTGTAGAIVDAFVGSPDPDSKNIRAAAPTVLKLLLEGRLLVAEGQREQGLALMQQAVDLEQTLAPAIGPAMPQPAAEALADAYLEMGAPDQARENYELALARAVKRRRSMEGLQAVTVHASATD